MTKKTELMYMYNIINIVMLSITIVILSLSKDDGVQLNRFSTCSG
ncbi:MAG: hypothetical protein M5U17_05900 [Ignavibacterium sp.]|nr:hypothetical protein [Ignavibacterium sp.]